MINFWFYLVKIYWHIHKNFTLSVSTFFVTDLLSFIYTPSGLKPPTLLLHLIFPQKWTNHNMWWGTAIAKFKKKKQNLTLEVLTNWIRLVDWWRVTLTWWAHYKRHKFDLAVWQLLNKEMSTKMYVPFTNFLNVPLLRNEGEVRNWGEGRGNHIVSSWLIIHDPLTFCPFVLVVSLSWLVQ